MSRSVSPGIPALADYRGQTDAAGYSLHVTVLAVADELAAAAELIMNKLDARRCDRPGLPVPGRGRAGYRARPGHGPVARSVSVTEGIQMLVKGIGYAASFEQFHPTDLLTLVAAGRGQPGFGGVMASDHFHPWVPSRGRAAFVWAWMGALGATTKLRFGTGVTPPGYRYHPAILAQAAATLEAMFPGRFYLGLGAGEALNEHIVGDYWPEAPVRLERLAESIEIIQQLFTGKVVKYRGEHFNVESAQALHPARDARRRSTSPPRGPIKAERTGQDLPTASSPSARRTRSSRC